MTANETMDLQALRENTSDPHFLRRMKARQGGRVVSIAVTIAVGVNDDRRREVLGMAVGCSEAETFWIDFLRKLTRRGRRDVKLVISDAHEGSQVAISRVLNAHLATLPHALHAQPARSSFHDAVEGSWSAPYQPHFSSSSSEIA